MITRVEIGSEFWLERPVPQPVADRDGVYTISGRTAIDVILQEVMCTRKVRNVMMPAWCCDSMIAPFAHRNIRVDFYDVCHTEITKITEKISNTDLTDETDILYFTNYFGYENTFPLETVK